MDLFSSINPHTIEVIKVAARSSALSRAQVQEAYGEISQHHPQIRFEPIWMQTSGDLDLKRSLRTLDKSDFFTREIDLFQLSGGCRISIHSAKDLPEPLAEGLCLVALTSGVGSADVLVLREKESIDSLAFAARIGTSSQRREENVRALRSDFVCVDIRGSIEQRLALLDNVVIDGLVVAQAALLRLKLMHRNSIKLPGETAIGQGQLAIITRRGDEQMKKLFACIDCR